MNGKLTIPMIAHDEEIRGPLMPRTMVELEFTEDRIDIRFPEDLRKDDTLPEEERPTYPRSVWIEFNEDEVMKVHVYPFDKDEPVTIEVGLDGGYSVEKP